MTSWFQKIEDKDKTNFIQGDIEAFYPNISEQLLDDALSWAKSHVNISADEIEIIKKTKQNLLFSDEKPWVKKDNSECDVTMGSWDGAEVCELVGLYLLSQVQHLKRNNFGMYRDDVLCENKQRPQQAEKTKKEIDDSHALRERGEDDQQKNRRVPPLAHERKRPKRNDDRPALREREEDVPTKK